MSESLFSRAAAVAEPHEIALPSEVPAGGQADAPRGIALRRTTPRRVLPEPPAAVAEEIGARLQQIAADRPTPAPRAGGWRALLGGAR